MKVFGCSLHSLEEVQPNNCSRKIFLARTCVLLSAIAQKLPVMAPLSLKELLALAIDPQTKYIFLGMFILTQTTADVPQVHASEHLCLLPTSLPH